MSKNKTPVEIKEESLRGLFGAGFNQMTSAKMLGTTPEAVKEAAQKFGIELPHNADAWKSKTGLPKPPTPYNEKLFQPPHENAGVPFAELSEDQCYWGFDNGKFCGEPIKQGFQYCASHCENAYVPPTPKQDAQLAEPLRSDPRRRTPTIFKMREYCRT